MKSNSAIQIQNLSKTYANGVKAVNAINLTIQRGDFFALLGPNGAGKSSIIGMISSLVSKTAGQIEIMGYDLDHQAASAKQLLGVVPQELNFSIFEIVSDVLLYQAAYYGIRTKQAKAKLQQVLELVDLWDKRDQKIHYLSGGMKRRLMVARALIHSPKVLILDEPTAGVDIEIRQSLWNNLKLLNETGLTIVLTTHYLEEAEQLCNRIAIIDKGIIMENTTMDKLLASLNQERFVLYLKHPINSDRDQFSYPITIVEPTVLELELARGQDITQAIVALSQQGITIDRMRNKSNRLEQLFMDIINRQPNEQVLS